MAFDLTGWLLSLASLASHLPDFLFAVGIIISVRIVREEGWGGLLRRSLSFARLFPGVDWLISLLLRSYVKDFLKQIDHGGGTATAKRNTMAIPEKG